MHTEGQRIHPKQLILGRAGEIFTFPLHTSVFEVFYNELEIVCVFLIEVKIYICLFNPVIPLLKIITKEIIREAVKSYV